MKVPARFSYGQKLVSIMEKYPGVFKMRNILQHRRKIFREMSFHENSNSQKLKTNGKESFTEIKKETKSEKVILLKDKKQPSVSPPKIQTSIQNLMEMDLKKLMDSSLSPAFLQYRTRQMIRKKMENITEEQKYLDQKRSLKKRKAVSVKRMPPRVFPYDSIMIRFTSEVTELLNSTIKPIDKRQKKFGSKNKVNLLMGNWFDGAKFNKNNML